jgi:hypothetical protein
VRRLLSSPRSAPSRSGSPHSLSSWSSTVHNREGSHPRVVNPRGSESSWRPFATDLGMFSLWLQKKIV